MNGFRPGGENCSLLLGAFNASNTMYRLGLEEEFWGGMAVAVLSRKACLDACPNLGSCGAELDSQSPIVKDTGLTLGEVARGFESAATIGSCGVVID